MMVLDEDAFSREISANVFLEKKIRSKVRELSVLEILRDCRRCKNFEKVGERTSWNGKVPKKRVKYRNMRGEDIEYVVG